MEENKRNKIWMIISIVSVIIIIVLSVMLIKNNNNNGNSNNANDKVEKVGDEVKKADVKIKESETKAIKYTDFDNGLVKMKLPEGWKVDVLGDCIHYTIKAYDPQRPTYQFFFNLKTEGYNKYEEAKAFQQRYYPDIMFAKTSVIADKTTEGFYKIFNDLGPLNNTAAFTFPTLNDFTVVEKLGAGTLGGDILRASFKDENGKEAEGLFTAYVYNTGQYYVPENVISGKQIDIYYLNVYDAIFVRAPKDELVDWEETLNAVASSVEFTDTFMSGFNSDKMQ
ncbi:MAG: hypothetical protein V8R51_01400 [Clostridia bacterium]